mgnify:CR=1 FL=1
MKGRIVARLGAGLLRVYLTPEERAVGVHSVGIMGTPTVVSPRIAGLLGSRAWAEVEVLLSELQAAGVRVWRVGEPEGLSVSGEPS